MGRFTAIGRDREVYGNMSRWGICRDREIAPTVGVKVAIGRSLLQKRGWFLSNKRSRIGVASYRRGGWFLSNKRSRSGDRSYRRGVRD